MENQNLKLLVTLLKAANSVSEFIRIQIPSYQLNVSEFMVLELLNTNHKVAINEIGQKVLLSSGSMTYVINQLEKKGYIHRLPCTLDRRKTYIQLTDVGKELITAIFEIHKADIAMLFNDLSEKEKKDSIAINKKIGIKTDAITTKLKSKKG